MNIQMFEINKIGIVKRASAWLLDAILIAVLATGFMWIVSLICGFEGKNELARQYNSEWTAFREECIPGAAEYYGFTYEETESGYTVTKDGEQKDLGDIVAALIKDVAGSYGFTFDSAENTLTDADGNYATVDDVIAAMDASEEEHAMGQTFRRYAALPPDATVSNLYSLLYTMLFMIVSLGLFFAFLCLEFILPLILKNGQTVGKKVFGICLVHPNCVKISGVSLFARAILGKYAIETMFPVLLVFLFFFGGVGLLAVILFAALLLLNVILFFATKNRTPIHDLLAVTVAADMRTQMIYASEEELKEKKEEARRQAELEAQEEQIG